MSIVLNCVARASSGKSASRKARSQSLVPSVIYTKDGKNINVSLYLIEIENLLKDSHFYTKTLTLRVFPETCQDKIKKLGAEISEKPVAEYMVIPREAQFNVISDRPSHLDFAIVKKGDKVKVDVPVKLHNAEKNPVIRFGGSLLVLAYNVKIVCHVGDIPLQIDIDVSATKSGQILRISDLTLPQNCSMLKDRDIVKISGKRGSDTATEASV